MSWEEPLWDAHTHLSSPERVADFARYCRIVNVERYSVVSLPDPARINFNPEALYAKLRDPERCYALCGFDYSELWYGEGARELDLAEQVDEYWRFGADGLKLWTGKPSFQRELGIDLRHRAFRDAFAIAASRRFPVVIHIADPPEFWEGRLGGINADLGLSYEDPGTPGFEELLSQAEHVAQTFPDLPVIFAHVLFLAGDLDRLSAFLERYPQASVDLAPGMYMYGELAARPEQSREFFRAYADRILFGTDGFWFSEEHHWLPQASLHDNVERARQLIGFLSTEARFPNPFGPTQSRWPEVRSLDLPAEVLRKLFWENAWRLFGASPRRLDPDALSVYLERFRGTLVDNHDKRDNSAKHEHRAGPHTIDLDAELQSLQAVADAAGADLR
jgi:predicted TIM-barrel fold metal-dependent hydrolase